MKNLLWRMESAVVVFGLVFALGCSVGVGLSEGKKTDVEKEALSRPGDGFVPLFNGEDLSGWKIPAGDNGHWKVVDGVIDYDARSEAKDDKNLWTKESFGDFVLQIEWRIKETRSDFAMPIILPDGSLKKDEKGEVIRIRRPNADSGIFLRGDRRAQVNIWCWPIGSGEVEWWRKNEAMPAEVRAACVPKVRADNPVGQWNKFVITMKGERLTVVLNGRTVIENAYLPGVAERGPIGLQHHRGSEKDKKTGEYKYNAASFMQFRNICIRELEATGATELSHYKGWRDLLAKDLSNCVYEPGTWAMEEGVLIRKSKGNIWTKEKYGDFVLEAEFKLAGGGNSGIFLRAGDIEKWLHTAIEVQILNSYGKSEVRKNDCGAIYACLAPSKNMVKKPGEWNHITITCKDNKIYVVMNGEQIIDMDLNLWTESHKNPDGTPNKFNTAYKDMPRVGYLGFQSHGDPVWFRNIKIKTLDD